MFSRPRSVVRLRLPDDIFRNLIWYVLAPPEEGPLTKEKREALSAPVTAEPVPPKSGGDGVPRGAKVDWESVSLWNPDWKVTAPEFEGTPTKCTSSAIGRIFAWNSLRGETR